MTSLDAAGEALTLPDRALSWGLGVGVLLLYVLTFASVPTSDGLSFIAMVDGAIASGTGRLPVISNAPFSYYLAFFLKRAALALRLLIPTLLVFQGINAVVTALGSVAFYRTIRLIGGAPFWAFVGTMLMATSYGVWYFANGEVHHVALAILLFLFYRLTLIRRSVEGPSSYAALVGLGLPNAVAVFFHQEHFLFGLVAVALLLVGRPWRRASREIAAYGGAGTLGTMLLILVTGWLAAGARTLKAIVAWYFWQLGYLVSEYEPEPIWLIALRLMKGQLTAFVYGVQVIADAARDWTLLQVGAVRVFAALTVLALALAATPAAGVWWQRRRITGDLRAFAVAAVVWLFAYPVLLSWYFPAVTEYYLKTMPPLVLLLVLGPIARERVGLASRWLRAVGAGLLLLVVTVNGLSAILPWYRYGIMRDRLAGVASALFRPGDLVVSIESGIDPVLAGRVEQVHVKDLLYWEGKERGFETIHTEIGARLDRGQRVFVHNLIPSRFALTGLNDPSRNQRRDRYDLRDFEAFLDELSAHYQLVQVLAYWEESKEPLYLFGRRLEPLYEVRRRF